MSQPDFWNNPEQAQEVSVAHSRLQTKLTNWQELHAKIADLSELSILSLQQHDSSMLAEIQEHYLELAARYHTLRIEEFLNQEYDTEGAFLSIHSGAGGTESCDWVTMLLRMYLRWCERHSYHTTTLDQQDAEGGIKSITLQINGHYCFGYLKGESGIHRLVRISPFDSSGRRHTTFSSVVVSPVINHDINIDIKPADIRVDTYRASGAGGQHVNKTDSAVRITHLATGIVVQCQSERSQHINKESALRILRSRIYQRQKEEEAQRQAALEGEKRDIAWGNQIRSYIFQPYTMVKDHRFGHTTGNISAVMDGQLDPFIEKYLTHRL